MTGCSCMGSVLERGCALKLVLCWVIDWLIESMHAILQVMSYNPIRTFTSIHSLGPGFDSSRRSIDPKISAKNVVCINTSTDKGTNKYNCHQNFRMGKCGKTQPAASRRPMGDHGLCPYFYNSAFKNKFVPTKNHDCRSKNEAPLIPMGFTMGYSRPRYAVKHNNS